MKRMEYQGEPIKFPYPLSLNLDIDDVLFRKVDSLLVVGYIDLDSDPEWDRWGEDMGGLLEIFTSEHDRDNFAEEVFADKKQCFIVDNYSHGNNHFSIQNTRWYPDRRWDVAPRGIFVPPDDMQKQYHKRKYAVGCDKARFELVGPSNSILDEYSKYCNGEVYGAIVFFNGREDLEEDSCWGYIGYEHALSSLEESFEYTCERAREIARAEPKAQMRLSL